MILKEQSTTCVWNDRDTKMTKPPSVSLPGNNNWTYGRLGRTKNRTRMERQL